MFCCYKITSVEMLFLTGKSQLFFGDTRHMHFQVYSIFYRKVIVEAQSKQMCNLLDSKSRLQDFKGSVHRKSYVLVNFH